MDPITCSSPPRRSPPQGPYGQAAGLPLALQARLANIAMTAQVQLAYACAENARHGAEDSAQRIERAWPRTPLRDLMVDAYRAQARAAAMIARDVLAGARGRCGLAFARWPAPARREQ